MDEETKRIFIDNIKNNIHPYRFNSSRTELIIRCPYCGDSFKDSTHAHLYIGLDKDDYLPYYCQRCGTKGVVNNEFLKDLKLYDYELNVHIKILNKNSKANNKIKSNSKLINNKTDYIIPEFSNTKSERNKLNYINNRFGFEYDADYYIENYHTIFSLKKFILENKLENTIPNNDYLVKELILKYIGFLSYNNSFIIMRNTDLNADKHSRHFIYNLDTNNKEQKRFYVPKQKISLLANPLTIIICEGVFDLIAIKEYFYKGINNENMVFVSVSGKGYNLVLNHFARMGFVNMNIIIYSDKDVDLGYYRYLKRQSSTLRNNPIKIIYNQKNKDFGVRKELIELKEYKL